MPFETLRSCEMSSSLGSERFRRPLAEFLQRVVGQLPQSALGCGETLLPLALGLELGKKYGGQGPSLVQASALSGRFVGVTVGHERRGPRSGFVGGGCPLPPGTVRGPVSLPRPRVRA